MIHLFSDVILSLVSFIFRWVLYLILLTCDSYIWFIHFQMHFLYMIHSFSCDSYKWLMYFQMWLLYWIHLTCDSYIWLIIFRSDSYTLFIYFQMWFLHMNHSFSWFLQILTVFYVWSSRYSFYFQMRFLQMIHLFFSQMIHFSHMILTHDPLMISTSQLWETWMNCSIPKPIHKPKTVLSAVQFCWLLMLEAAVMLTWTTGTLMTITWGNKVGEVAVKMATGGFFRSQKARRSRLSAESGMLISSSLVLLGCFVPH